MDLKLIKEAQARMVERGTDAVLLNSHRADMDRMILFAATPDLIKEVERLIGTLRHIQFAERSENIDAIIIAAIGPAEGDPS